MIVFNSLGNNGRLGNLMFQYAALKALAHKLNCQAKIPANIFNRIHHGQQCLLNCFNINCNVYQDDELKDFNYFNESDYCNGGYYTDKFWSCDKNTILHGYFESELYFENIKDEIKKEYELKDEYKNYVIDYMKNIKTKYVDHEIIGVHIRRGDYLDPQNGAEFITTPEYNIIYLKKAFNHFNDLKKKVYIIFTGGSVTNNNDNNEDIIWCKNNIVNNNEILLYSENNNTIQDLGLMSLCDHLILNSSSTLGWWAAYLNTNINKKIIVPKNLGFKSEDTFWLSSFIKI
jgi:hypothetical protein